MKQIGKLKMVLVLALVTMLVAAVPVAAATPGSQTWYLTKSEYIGAAAVDGTLHSCDNVMSKDAPGGRCCCSIEWIGEICSLDMTAWWYSEGAQPEGISATFPAGGIWYVNLLYWNSIGSGTLLAEIVYVDESGAIGGTIASGSVPITAMWQLKEVSIACDSGAVSKTVPGKNRLALRLAYDADCWADGMLIFYGAPDCLSSVVSPETDPGFPTPELSTILLLGSGLVCLAGYRIMARRNSKTR